ncbi:MAG: hypothetical protein ACREP7_18085, partial [Lysobacter sp.]
PSFPRTRESSAFRAKALKSLDFLVGKNDEPRKMTRPNRVYLRLRTNALTERIRLFAQIIQARSLHALPPT